MTTLATSRLLIVVDDLSVASAGYEEEEEDYGYSGHMRQASLELNVTQVASPRGNSGKYPERSLHVRSHTIHCAMYTVLWALQGVMLCYAALWFFHTVLPGRICCLCT